MALDAAGDDDARMDMRALWLALRRRLARIILVTAVLLAATYAALLFVPKSYDSTAGILVESRDNVYTRPANDTTGASQPGSDALGAIISSQIELIKSRDTLLAVVRSEKLTEIPEFNGTANSPLSSLFRFLKKPSVAADEDTAVDILSDHLLATRERDSAVINVQVSSTDPALAARLANAVAQADVSRRAGLTLSDTADASQWLDQQITPLRQRVADAENKVANFKVDNDLYAGTGGTNGTSLVDQQLAQISTQITAAQERQNTAQSRSTLIRGLLAANQPIDGVDDVRNSVTIQQLTQQKAQLTAQRAQLLATLLPTHPTVEAVTAQISSIDKQIGVEGRRVADALDAEAKIEASLLKSLQANLDSLKTKAADATRQNVTLDALTREANADRDLLQSYLSRYRDAASRTDANSDLPDVRVVTLAVAATSPSSPRTSLIMGAVAFVSLAVQIGAILFGELLSGRAIADPRKRRVGVREDETEVPADLPGDAVWRRVDPATHEVVEVPDEAEPEDEVAAIEPEPEPEPVARRSEGRGLRSWFSKRARSVGASLTAFEPPMGPEDASARLQSVVAASPEATTPDVQDAATVEEADAPLDYRPTGGTDSADHDNDARLADLSADLILGRARIVLLAALDDHHDSEAVSEQLIAEVLHRGLSVARVDAGSGQPSTEPGITDLSSERASFGDVVHKTAEEGLAEIPWGHLTTMDRRSTRPITLVEALSDIYEVVLVLTGRVGMASTLPLFAGLPCRLVLVTSETPDPARVEAARHDFAALGFDAAEVIGAPALEAEVA